MGPTEKQVPTSQESGDLIGTATNTDMIDDDPAILARAEFVSGKFPSHERVRIVRPSRSPFKQVGRGMFQATEAQAPTRGAGRVFYRIKRTLIGAPIANEQAEHERLTKVKALAVLSSDAISSVAYATEAALLILFTAGTGSGALTTILPISIAIIALLTIVAISYRQTIPAYPNGGGSYIVAKDNLGDLAGLIAAASLLIDYVLTVSVSVASGVQNFLVLFPSAGLINYQVPIDVALVLIITVVNLRGVRESGSIFAFPTYFFVVTAFLMILVGLFKGYVLQHQGFIEPFPIQQATTQLTFFLVLRAFASGCSAMTGVEAISNGVPAFKKPETRNATKTLTAMAVILGGLFAGLTLLTLTYAPHIHLDPSGAHPLIAQVSSQVFTGPLSFMYYLFQAGTLLILVLAANTSYSDFPRLASLLARDNFLPHQFAFRGDRLAFSIGIVFLAILASLLLIVFNGDISHLIDLYAVGVFMSFTLSQSGMVRHWWRLRATDRGARRRMVINAAGAVATLLVALIIASTKFTSGAWIVVILIPLLVAMFMGIHTHYTRVERERTTNIPARPADIKHLFIVPIAGMDSVSIQSLAYARSVAKQVVAVHVAVDPEDAHRVREAWTKWQQINIAAKEKTELVIIESPYRSLNRPLLDYIDTVHELYPQYTVTVLLPEFVVAHLWEHLLHNQTALRLKAALLFRPGIIVTSVPQHLPSRQAH